MSPMGTFNRKEGLEADRDEWRERALAAEVERDENEAAFKVWRRRCEAAEAERDEARAALADCLAWMERVNQFAQPYRDTASRLIDIVAQRESR